MNTGMLGQLWFPASTCMTLSVQAYKREFTSSGLEVRHYDGRRRLELVMILNAGLDLSRSIRRVP